MSTPILYVEPDALRPGSFEACRAVAEQVLRRLREYPHFVLLKGPRPSDAHEPVMQVARVITNLPPIKESVSPEKRAKVSFTKVRINPALTLHSKGSTNYSRTSRALTLHSDSSYLANPHELVAFQMVRADRDGGDTLMAPLEDVLSRLDAKTVDVLSRPTFPFGRGRFPVLWFNAGDPRIRYYRNQIDLATENGDTLGSDERAAMERLDEAVAESGLSHRFRIEEGETLFIRNVKVLHGRTEFAPDSRRLMYRFRAHAGCLG